jgi:hypothetical protein
MKNRRLDEAKRRTFEEALENLVARLKRPLSDLPDDELDGLARRITRLQFSWDARPPIPS